MSWQGAPMWFSHGMPGVGMAESGLSHGMTGIGTAESAALRHGKAHAWGAHPSHHLTRLSFARVLHRVTYHKVVPFQNYKSFIPELLAQPEPHYVLFTSGVYEGSDIPWCPDCAVSVPIVR